MGFLLPTLVSLKTKLNESRDDLKTAVPLVDALLHGISNRFGEYFDRKDLILATVTLPSFVFDGLKVRK